MMTGQLLSLWTRLWGYQSYLAVGLLFGLTLPGISAHGFLGGGGMDRIIYLRDIISIQIQKDIDTGHTEGQRKRALCKRFEW